MTHSAFISRNCIMCPAWPLATAGEPPSRADYNSLPIANAKRSKNDANDAAAIGEAMTRRRCDLSRSNLNVAA